MYMDLWSIILFSQMPRRDNHPVYKFDALLNQFKCDLPLCLLVVILARGSANEMTP